MVRVGVVGAGAAGLCVARNALEAGHQVQIWEQCCSIGGTWVYNEETGTHSSMYEVMKTNLPKETMAFPGHPFPHHLPSFITHQQVLQYITEYGGHLDVQLKTRVLRVERNGERWMVEIEKEGEKRQTEVDVLFVCNGHYSHPNRPFDEKRFTKGSIVHSHDYRSNRGYRDRKVAVVGAGPSGIDIALQVAEVAQKVILLGHGPAVFDGWPDNLELIDEKVTAIHENGIELNNNNHLLECDDIIICTGYHYNFPFLSPEIGIRVEEQGKRVSGLFLHMASRRYPDSLFFIGLPFVLPFILFQAQTSYALALIDGIVQPPSAQEMESEEAQRIRALKDRSLPMRMYHMLGADQWDYFEELQQRAKRDDPFFSSMVRHIFELTAELRKDDIAAYKDFSFHIVDGHLCVEQ